MSIFEGALLYLIFSCWSSLTCDHSSVLSFHELDTWRYSFCRLFRFWFVQHLFRVIVKLWYLQEYHRNDLFLIGSYHGVNDVHVSYWWFNWCMHVNDMHTSYWWFNWMKLGFLPIKLTISLHRWYVLISLILLDSFLSINLPKILASVDACCLEHVILRWYSDPLVNFYFLLLLFSC